MKNKKKIEKNYKNQFEAISIYYIYTNENDINDKINVTTIFTITKLLTLRSYLKFNTLFTIYSKKFYDIILTMCMHMKLKQNTTKKLIIYIDNQTIIKTMYILKINSNQFLIK